MMAAFLPELRIAVRSLLRSPGFLSAAVLILALGTGVNTALFSVLDSLLWKPLPFPDPERLMVVQRVAGGDLREWETSARSAAAIGGVATRTWLLEAGAGGQQVVLAGMATHGFWRAVPVPVAIGRGMAAEDGNPAAKHVWLSHDLWMSRFHGQVSALGQRITLNEEPYLVAGVLPAEFRFPVNGAVPDVYFALDRSIYPGHGPGGLTVFARLNPSTPAADAQAELTRLAASFTPGHRVDLQPVEAQLRGGSKSGLWLLTGAGLMMLLIAITNVAGLMSARAASKQGESLVRRSAGASSWQLMRPRMAEALVVSCTGLAAGWLAARWCLELLPHAAELFPTLRGAAELRPPALDAWAFGFAVLCAILAAAAGTLQPVRMRGLLTAGQVALTFTLLLGGSVLVRSLWNVMSTPLGFEPEGVLTAGIGLPEVRYSTEARMLAFHEEVIAKLAAAPGVAEAAAAIPVPMAGRMRTRYGVEQKQVAAAAVVSPGYFRLMRIPLLRGRDFTWRDRLGQPPVCIISRDLARAEFGEADPTGRRLKMSMTNGPSYPRGTEWEVVGVAAEVRQQGAEQPGEPQAYFPLGQVVTEGLVYLMRTPDSAAAMEPVVRAAVHAVDPAVQKPGVNSQSGRLDEVTRDRRWIAAATSLFAAAGLLLSAIGLYGLVSYTVARRTREIGIRMALGASASSTARHMMLVAMGPVVFGMIVGAAISALAAGFVAPRLAGVTPADPLSITATCAAILLACALASAIPAWRATRIPITRVLRTE